jgi:hypothetical protein
LVQEKNNAESAFDSMPANSGYLGIESIKIGSKMNSMIAKALEYDKELWPFWKESEYFSDLMRFNPEYDSNEMDERESQCRKHDR